MGAEYYVSPEGVEQLVSTQREKVRLRYKGWMPKSLFDLPEVLSLSKPEPEGKTEEKPEAEPEVTPKKTSSRKSRSKKSAGRNKTAE